MRFFRFRAPPPDAVRWEERYRQGYAGGDGSVAELGHFAVVASYIRAACPASPRILDAGCGRGQLLDQFGAGELGSYDAFDLSETAILDARARAGQKRLDPSRVVVAGFESWTSRSELDAVVFCEALSYASNPEETLRRFLGMTVERGIAVVSLFQNHQARIIGRMLHRRFRVIDQTGVVHAPGKRWEVRIIERA